jgi:hypothetical protein
MKNNLFKKKNCEKQLTDAEKKYGDLTPETNFQYLKKKINKDKLQA